MQIGHAAATLCHLGNIAYRVGHEVKFDPQLLNFGSDNDANALLVNSRAIVS
ncbi:hypothetical protein [Schlesneria sp.]|uniref:hypothetical protein n=1 Tax=Schlesneria sp. TaxID=2762018 RepID=UPI002F179221